MKVIFRIYTKNNCYEPFEYIADFFYKVKILIKFFFTRKFPEPRIKVFQKKGVPENFYKK